MKMIDLYIDEIGQKLPLKNREDLKREIRSLVEDAVDDAGQGRETTEELVVEVLKKFGSPEKVAASYQSPRYLIGPNLFPTFLMVARIVLVVITILSAIGLGISLGRTPSDSGEVLGVIGEGLIGLLNSIVGSIGYVVLVFAVIQWLSPDFKVSQDTWDPRSLKAVPDPERVNEGELTIEILLSLALLVVLNIYQHWIGLTMYVDGAWLHAPVLSPIFARYLPWVSLSLVGTITLNTMLIRSGSWTPFLKWFSVVINIAAIILLAVILSGPSIISIDSTELIRNGWPQNLADTLAQALPAISLVFRMALGISLVMQVIELVKKLYQMVAPKLSLPVNLTS